MSRYWKYDEVPVSKSVPLFRKVCNLSRNEFVLKHKHTKFVAIINKDKRNVSIVVVCL